VASNATLLTLRLLVQMPQTPNRFQRGYICVNEKGKQGIAGPFYKLASNAPRAHNALVGQHPKPFERLTAAALSAFADAHENDFQKHKQGNTCFNQRKRATGPHRMKHPPAQNAVP